jgi:hypothetical protein
MLRQSHFERVWTVMSQISIEKAKFGQAKSLNSVSVIGSMIGGVASCALISGLSLVLSPASSSAVGIIDNFETCTNPGAIVPPCFTGLSSPGNTSYTTTAAAVDAISTTRNIFFAVSENSPGDGAFASLNIDRAPVNKLALASNVGDASFSITYSGLSAILSTLGGGSNTRFNFNVNFSDADLANGRGQTVGLVLRQGGFDYTSSFPLNTPVVTNQSFFLPFSGFNIIGGHGPAFNPNAAVSQIVLSASGLNAPDLSFESLVVDAVPFEYSHELGLVGLTGLFGAYKLRSKKSSKVQSEKTDV